MSIKKKTALGAATLGAGPAKSENTKAEITSQDQPPIKPRLYLMDLDDIHFHMKCAIDLVDAVHEAMICGSFTAETYTDALFGAKNYLYSINDELRLCVDDMLDKRKRDATA